jgi:hypothetical protein
MRRKNRFLSLIVVFFLIGFLSTPISADLKFTGNHFTVGNLKDITEEDGLVYAISDDYLFIWEKPAMTSPDKTIKLLSATRVNAQDVPSNELTQMVYHRNRVFMLTKWHVMAYDVTEPKKPAFLSKYFTDDSTAAIEAYGDYLYLTCHGADFYVISYRNPRNPVLVHHMQSQMSFANGLYEVNGYLLMTCPNWVAFQTDVYDLSNPAVPSLQHSAPFIFRLDNHIDGCLYGHGRWNDGENWVQVLRKIDAARLPVLAVLASAVFDETFEGVGFDRQYAYVMRHHKYYSLYERPSTVEQWRMGDWSNPRLVRTAEADSSIHDCVSDDRFVYVADGIRGLKAYPIGPLQSVQWRPWISRFLLEPVDVLSYDNYAFYVCENRWSDSQAIIEPQGEINILDTSNPLAPKLVASIPEYRIVNIADAKIWQGHLYVLRECEYLQQGEVAVYRIAPGSPPALDLVDYHKVDNDMCLAFHKETMMVTGLFTDVDFFDISDPSKIVYLSTYLVPTAWPCYWEGVVDTMGREYYYLPWGSDASGFIHGYGVKVLDISDPKNPLEVQDVLFEFGKMEIAQEAYHLYSAHWHSITVVDVRRPDQAYLANDHVLPPDIWVWIASTAEKTLLVSGDYAVGNFYQPCILRMDISRPPWIGEYELVDSHQYVLDLAVPKDELLYSVELDNLGIYKFSLGQ